MIGMSLIFLGGAIEAYLETLPTACAFFSVCAFVMWFGGVMAPDSEKYTPEYLRKYKGWS
jgi:hypothetical protein